MAVASGRAGPVLVRPLLLRKRARAHSEYTLIDLMQMTSSPHVTKRETDGGRKFGYYATITSGKNDRGLWSLSTAEQFVSSFLTSAGSDFTFTPRMHKVSTGPNAH